MFVGLLTIGSIFGGGGGGSTSTIRSNRPIPGANCRRI
jgi:hypothetical protein